MDVLFGALGAIIFLFIVVPKGGAPPDEKIVIPVYVDEGKQMIFGEFKQALPDLVIGDSAVIVASSLSKFPTAKDCPPPVICPPCPECPTCPPCPPVDKPPVDPIDESPDVVTTTTDYPIRPAVPSAFSIEIIWDDADMNVDLWVCRGQTCVHGHRRNRRNRDIGVWYPDLGETTFVGLFTRSSLRSNIEAVRQIDERIPGTFDIYGYFKESDIPASNVDVKVFVYSDADAGPKMKGFKANLTLGSPRKKLATVELMPDGTFRLNEY